jgi:hypothetical protein
LSGLGLYHCTQYFSIVKKETRSCPVDVDILLNHINSLCTIVIGVCSRVFSFQTCLSNKGLVENWLPINHHIYIYIFEKLIISFPNTMLLTLIFAIIKLKYSKNICSLPNCFHIYLNHLNSNFICNGAFPAFDPPVIF